MFMIKGEIGFYNLVDWWMSEFNDSEREHIMDIYRPMGMGPTILTIDEILDSNHSDVSFLSILAGWFNNRKDRYIAFKILNKAEDLINKQSYLISEIFERSSEESNLFDLHFLYISMIQVHYPNRNEDINSFNKAIKACEESIKIAPRVISIFKKESFDGFMPGHIGYEQLAIVKEKETKYQEAINLCSKALNEGWNGEWQHRINRCEKKLTKSIKL